MVVSRSFVVPFRHSNKEWSHFASVNSTRNRQEIMSAGPSRCEQSNAIISYNHADSCLICVILFVDSIVAISKLQESSNHKGCRLSEHLFLSNKPFFRVEN